MIYVPKGFYFTLRGQRYAYHYPTRPVGPAGQVEVWTRGKGLGGSTAVNGMMWMRGAAADWDDSERVGFSPSTIRHVRTSAYSAFVRPVRRRRNLTVITHARADHLLFDGNRAVGVRAMTGGANQDHLTLAYRVIHHGDNGAV